MTSLQHVRQGTVPFKGAGALVSSHYRNISVELHVTGNAQTCADRQPSHRRSTRVVDLKPMNGCVGTANAVIV